MVVNFFIQLFIAIAVSAVAYLIAPRPRQQYVEAPAIKEPTSEAGLSVPYVYGTITVRGPNVVDFFDKRRQDLGQGRARYRMSVHYGICMGPIQAVRRIRIGERVAWGGELTNDNAFFNLYDPEFWEESNGGIAGRVMFRFGSADQKQHARVAAKYGEEPDTMPGYRGMTHVMFTDYPNQVTSGVLGFNWGDNSPVVPAVDVMVTSIPDGWYPEKAVIPVHPDLAGTQTDPESEVEYTLGPNCNPVHVLYDLLTNPTLSNRLLPAEVDDAAFRKAADTLFDEKFGVSFEWRPTDQPRREFIAEILRHIDGFMFLNVDTGLMDLRLVRGDYDLDEALEFDESNSTLTNPVRQPASELPNQVSVKWRNPINEEAEAATIQNLASIISAGNVLRDYTYDFVGIRDPETASNTADRELVAVGEGLFKCDINANRSARGVVPGDVVLLTSERENLVRKPVRVMNVVRGGPGSSEIALSVVEDVFSRRVPDFTRQAQGGRPGRPRDFRLTQERDSVLLQWAAPTNEGSSPVIYYETQQNYGLWSRVPGAALERRIGGLVDGNSYAFRVRAVNRTGPGVPSITLTLGPDSGVTRVPGVPQDFYAVVDDRDIEMFWKPPISDGGSTITRYEYELDDLRQVNRIGPDPGNQMVQIPTIDPPMVTSMPRVPAVDKRGPTSPLPPSQDSYFFKPTDRLWGNRPGRTIRWSHATRNLAASDGTRQTYLNGGNLPDDLLQITRDAFASFARYLNVNFQEVADAADVDCRVGYGDAASGLTAIAWAVDFRPWGPLRKTCIAYNALKIGDWVDRTPEHEVGHIIGLLHPDQSPNNGGVFRDNLMETIGSSIRTGSVQKEPRAGDIIALQHLWGPAPGAPTTVPDVPANLVVAPGAGRVVLTWGEPLINGGLNIEGYRVTIKTDAGEVTVETVNREYPDEGLRSGQMRQYRVQALNSNGVGLSTRWVTARVG